MKFKLNVELGNAAMETTKDVARALLTLAKMLDAKGDVKVRRPEDGTVRDLNGNRVGTWEFVREQ